MLAATCDAQCVFQAHQTASTSRFYAATRATRRVKRLLSRGISVASTAGLGPRRLVSTRVGVPGGELAFIADQG
jgi:hypothetical protein